MVDILSLSEVANIAGVHIKMDTSKVKVIIFHMQDRRILHFRAFFEGLFYTNLDDPIMVTDPIDTSVNPYSFLSTMKQNYAFSLIMKSKERVNFDSYSNISTGQ